MTEQQPSHNLVTRIQEAIDAGPDAVASFCRDQILQRSFETQAVSYYGDDDYEYHRMNICPSRFGTISYHLEPSMGGFEIRISSTFDDKAPLQPLEDEELQRLGDAEELDVRVTYRGHGSFGPNGKFISGDVFITKRGVR